VLSTVLVALAAVLVVLLPIRTIFHFGHLELRHFVTLLAIVVGYLIAAQVIKNRFYGGQNLKS